MSYMDMARSLIRQTEVKPYNPSSAPIIPQVKKKEEDKSKKRQATPVGRAGYNRPVIPTVTPPRTEVSAVKSWGGVPVGMDIIQPYKEDNAAQKIGKGIVNYGLGTAARMVDAPQQLIMQGSTNLANAIQGRPLDFSEKDFVRDILPTGAGEKLGQFKQAHPVAGTFAELLARDLGDPLNYVAGGTAFDLLKGATAKNTGKILTQTVTPTSTASSVADTLPQPKTIATESPTAGFNIPPNVNTPAGGLSGSDGVVGRSDGIVPDVDTLGSIQPPNLDIRSAEALGITPNGSKFGSIIPEGVKDAFMEKMVQDTYRISKYAKEMGSNHLHNLVTNVKVVGGITDNILNRKLVTKTGKVIGDSYGDVIKKVKDTDLGTFQDYLLHRHNPDRLAQGKRLFKDDVTADVSMAKVAEYERLHPEFKDAAESLNKFWNKFMDEWAVDSGLVSKEQMDNLRDMYKNYVPTKRVFSELEQATGKGLKQKYANVSKVIHKATGSTREIESPLDGFMQMIDRTVRSAKYNEVGQEILNTIRKNPARSKNMFEVVTDPSLKENFLKGVNDALDKDDIEGFIDTLGDQFDQIFAKQRKGHNIIRVMENGKPVFIEVKDKGMLDTILGLNKSPLGQYEKVAKKINNAFKAPITTYNPIFAVKNPLRDIPTGYINSAESNPFKYLADTGVAAKDIVTSDPLYRMYQSVGGGGGNFANEARGLAGLDINRTGVQKTFDGLNFINSTTENMSRFAEFKRVLGEETDNYDKVMEALQASLDVTTNFSAGGTLSKKIDIYVPYFNAAVRGIEKGIRQGATKPISTVAKGLVGVTSMTMFTDYINKDNPDYQALDNRTKDTNFLIPMGDGQFFKIPKTREYGVFFGSLAERLLRVSRGESTDKAFKGFGETVKTNFLPPEPWNDSLAAPLANVAWKNKDFANRPIVPQYMINDKRSPWLQYDEKTSEIGKKLGKMLNKSPKQIDYLIGAYTGFIGQLILPATTNMGGVESPTGYVTQPISNVFKRGFVADKRYNNQAIGDFYDNFDKWQQLASDRNQIENIPSDVVTPQERVKNDFAKASKDISDRNKAINKINASPMPKAEKEAQIKRLRDEILTITQRQNALSDKFMPLAVPKKK